MGRLCFTLIEGANHVDLELFKANFSSNNPLSNAYGLLPGDDFKVFDMNGRSVQEGTITSLNISDIRIDNLASGMYIIRAHGQNGTSKTFKFTK